MGYDRYLIWKKDDDSVMETVPPPQLKNLMSGIDKGGAAGEAAGGAEAAAGPAASLVRQRGREREGWARNSSFETATGVEHTLAFAQICAGVCAHIYVCV